MNRRRKLESTVGLPRKISGQIYHNKDKTPETMDFPRLPSWVTTKYHYSLLIGPG